MRERAQVTTRLVIHRSHAPSQTHTDLSRLHVARRFPDADHATLLTSLLCPSRVATHSNSATTTKEIVKAQQMRNLFRRKSLHRRVNRQALVQWKNA
jgi:hypothetical protein